MSRIGDFAASCARNWLDRFSRRHGLTDTTSHVTVAKDYFLRDHRADEHLLLHVGCGQATLKHIPSKGFQSIAWREIRLDADESVAPHIVGTMTAMPAVPTGSVDAVFSSHGIEHLYWHDVPLALDEFHRVLADTGFLVITCPDLQSAAKMIAEDRVFETAYLSPAGPITPFDMVYSYRPFVEANPQWMSHHCGFTLSTLVAVLNEAGFSSVHGIRWESGFELWVLASKSSRSPDELVALAADYLPVGN